MISVNSMSLRFGKRTLFEDVNLKFEGNNCYGIIGANGAGKSTFLKILSGDIETTTGSISIGKNERLSMLKQDHNAFDNYSVIETVIMGDTELYKIMKEREEIYARDPFTDKDGIRAGELEGLFLDKNGWEAESNAAILLSGLGMSIELQGKMMNELKDTDKVKVLLANALFGEPDILLLDEPTNGLDSTSKMWLEEFLINFKNTIMVVSHDRHFLNKVCTHMVDIDFERIKLFVGNYDFWYESSQLIQKQMRDSNKKKGEKIKELQDFIARFSANASKSKQATSRKKSLEKIELDDIKPSNRKYPFINFETDTRLGREVVVLENICASIDGKEILKNFNLTIRPDDKIALVGTNELAKTTLLRIMSGELTPDSGIVKIGSTARLSYFPKNHESYFENDLTLFEWLREYSEIKEESFVRGFLGRMLFSGEEVEKRAKVMSGGEKVRAMLSKMMLNKGNVLLLDEPTNHLDIESITALNNGLEKFTNPIVIATFDQKVIETVSNRLIDLKEDLTYLDKSISYDEYLEKYL
ncbi:MAG: ATP-binding cassette domain-containing protein [Bacilli bacterium]